MANRPQHLSHGLVLPLTLIRDLSQQIVLGPSQEPKRLSRGGGAAIREALDCLAERHGVPARDITYAIEGYADDMLSDATYGVAAELEREVEAQEPT